MFKVWKFVDEVSGISAYAARKQRQAVNDLDVSHREFTSESSKRSNGSQREESFGDSMVASSEHEIRTFHERFGHETAGSSQDDSLNGDSFSDNPGDGDGLAANIVMYAALAYIMAN